MTILTIDIGIKNLSYCIMDCEDHTDISTYKIHLWDVYNTLGVSEVYKCKSLQKNGSVCNKKCSFKRTDLESGQVIYSCKIHFPKDIIIKNINKVKEKKVKDYLLQDIATLFIKKVQDIFNENMELFKSVTSVLIELQLKINNSAKMMSHILFGKFVEFYKDTLCKIRFVSASRKLKAYTGPYIECKLKTPYAQRKWLSIKYTTWFLENKFCEEQRNLWLNDFLNSQKLDDRADCALMCINAIHGLPKKTPFVKRKRIK